MSKRKMNIIKCILCVAIDRDQEKDIFLSKPGDPFYTHLYLSHSFLGKKAIQTK